MSSHRASGSGQPLPCVRRGAPSIRSPTPGGLVQRPPGQSVRRGRRAVDAVLPRAVWVHRDLPDPEGRAGAPHRNADRLAHPGLCNVQSSEGTSRSPRGRGTSARRGGPMDRRRQRGLPTPCRAGRTTAARAGGFPRDLAQRFGPRPRRQSGPDRDEAFDARSAPWFGPGDPSRRRIRSGGAGASPPP